MSRKCTLARSSGSSLKRTAMKYVVPGKGGGRWGRPMRGWTQDIKDIRGGMFRRSHSIEAFFWGVGACDGGHRTLKTRGEAYNVWLAISVSFIHLFWVRWGEGDATPKPIHSPAPEPLLSCLVEWRKCVDFPSQLCLPKALVHNIFWLAETFFRINFLRLGLLEAYLIFYKWSTLYFIIFNNV